MTAQPPSHVATAAAEHLAAAQRALGHADRPAARGHLARARRCLAGWETALPHLAAECGRLAESLEGER